MSYYNHFKMIGKIDSYILPEVSFEQASISIEGLSFKKIGEMLIKLYKQVKSFILKVYNYTKQFALKFFDKDKNKEIKDSAKIVNNLLLNTKDHSVINTSPTTTMNELGITSEIMGSLKSASDVLKKINTTYSPEWDDTVDGRKAHYHLVSLFKDYRINVGLFFIGKDGKLFDADDLFNRSNGILKDLNELETLEGDVDDLYRDIITKTMISDGDIRNLYKTSWNEEFWEDIINNRLSKIEYIDFYKYAGNIESLVSRAEKFYNDNYRLIEKDLTECEKLSKTLLKQINNTSISDEDKSELRLEYNKISSRLQLLYFKVKVIGIPFSVLVMYTKLVKLSNLRIMKSELIYVNEPPYTPLLHISRNINLGIDSNNKTKRILYPKITRSNSKEFLPPRISFASSISSCCRAAYQHFDYYDGIEDNLMYKVFCLYEGINTSYTKYINPILTHTFVSDANKTKEVNCVTEIEIKFINYIKVYYKGIGNNVDLKRYEVITLDEFKSLIEE